MSFGVVDFDGAPVHRQLDRVEMPSVVMGGDLDGPDGHCARGCGGTVEAEVPKKEGISAKKKGTNRFAIVQRAEVSLTLNRLSHQTYVFP